METLKQAVQAYASRHANSDGLAVTPVPGLRMMFIESPRGDLHSIYRPLVCLVLQGAKQMIVGREERVFYAGQSVIVSADMPVVGRIVQASPSEPYLAVAVELEMTILRELAAQLGGVRPQRPSETRTLFAQDTEAATLDCASRLMRLLDRPDAAPLLRPGIMRELHYWLLSGEHGAALRTPCGSGQPRKPPRRSRRDPQGRVSVARACRASGGGSGDEPHRLPQAFQAHDLADAGTIPEAAPPDRSAPPHAG